MVNWPVYYICRTFKWRNGLALLNWPVMNSCGLEKRLGHVKHMITCCYNFWGRIKHVDSCNLRSKWKVVKRGKYTIKKNVTSCESNIFAQLDVTVTNYEWQNIFHHFVPIYFICYLSSFKWVRWINVGDSLR